MALETGTYISDLVTTNPAGTDTLDKADDHLRLIKSTVKATFPNITGAVTPTHTDLNKLTSAGSPQFSTIELGAASDTTITRSAAGVLAVEGGVIPKENRANTFTANQHVSVTDNTNAALRVTQQGTGPAFLVEDSASTDTTPFLIDASGSVGIGLNTGLTSLVHIASSSGNSPSNVTGENVLRLESTTTAAVGVGPSLLFQGQTGNSTAKYGFAGIQGFKASATANNYSGSLAFFTQNSGGGGTLVEQLRIDGTNNNVVVTGAGGLGYGTGSGGTVTQATSKGTAVTLNKTNGRVTTNNAALASGASIAFTLNNTTIAATDCLIVSGLWGVAPNYRLEVSGVSTGQAEIRITNVTGGSLSEAIDINFAVIKAVTS